MRGRTVVGVAGALALAMGAWLGASQAAPDRIFVNAKVWTGEAAMPEAEALAVRGDRIVAVGDSASVRLLAGATTEVIDLAGRRVVAGFNDAHWHLPTRRTADLVDAGNVQEMQRRLREFAATLVPTNGSPAEGGGRRIFLGIRPIAGTSMKCFLTVLFS